MPKKNTQRLTLDLGERSWNRITQLQELMEDGTKTAVVQSALQLLEYMVEQIQRRSTFLVRDAQGNTEQIQILGLRPSNFPADSESTAAR